MKLKHFKLFSFWIVLLISFLISSGFLLLNAAGFKVDWQHKQIQRTGLLTMEIDPKNAQVFVDGRVIPNQSPIQLTHLLPNQYDIEVKSPDYRTWARTLKIEAGIATTLDSVVLFFENPKIEPTTDKDIAELTQIPEEKGLRISGAEIYYEKNSNPTLITRLSLPIKNAIWYADQNHIIYQSNNEIDSAELDGRNVNKLLSLKNDDLTTMKLIENGRILLVKQNDTIYRVAIR